VLKQGQYAPLTVEREVAVLYALTRGHLDDIAVERVKEFEAALVAHLSADGFEIVNAIAKEKALSPAIEEMLVKHINLVKKSF
jgi:F-type H+-transporting ATPase subunit alpha